MIEPRQQEILHVVRHERQPEYAHANRQHDDIEAAGGTVDDIIKITFWVKDPAKQRAALNDEWVKMFPDPAARPARHTQPLPGDSRALVQADFMAVLS